MNFLEKNGFVLDIRNQKGASDRYLNIELPKIVRKYCKVKKINRSYTGMLLAISNNFGDFKSFILENKSTLFSEYLTTTNNEK